MNIRTIEPWAPGTLPYRHLSSLLSGRPAFRANEDDTSNWSPAVDIVEEGQRFVLRADLPGVDAENITIEMDKNVLSLAGERAAEKTAEADSLHRVERLSGKFQRRFSLPETADASQISARSKNGILEVSIPKLADVQPKRITVETA